MAIERIVTPPSERTLAQEQIAEFDTVTLFPVSKEGEIYPYVLPTMHKLLSLPGISSGKAYELALVGSTLPIPVVERLEIANGAFRVFDSRDRLNESEREVLADLSLLRSNLFDEQAAEEIRLRAERIQRSPLVRRLIAAVTGLGTSPS